MSEGAPTLSISRTADHHRPAWWMLALVALLAFAVYANSITNGFSFDDIAIVRDSQHVVNLEWTAIWYDNYWPRTEGVQPDILYRPITLWSYLANEALFPGAAWAFHLVNVSLHALVSVLLTLLAWRLIGDRRVALITGILFAVHPAHTEVVSNIVGRAELLAALWSLLALLVYLPGQPMIQEKAPRMTAKLPLIQLGIVGLACVAGILINGRPTNFKMLILPWSVNGAAIGMGVGLLAAGLLQRMMGSRWGVPEIRPWWHGCLAAFCFLIAILCKETPTTLLLAFLMIDVWRWLRWSSDRPGFFAWFATRAVRYYAPFGIMVALYLNLRRGAGALMADIRLTHHIVNPLVDATIPQRIVTPFMLLAKHLWLMFWPIRLSADYSEPSLMPTTNLFFGNTMQPPPIAGMLAVGLLILVAIKTRRKYPQAALIVGLFFAGYLLVANALRIGTIFGERLFYWPGSFILMLLSWGAVHFYVKTVSEIRTSRGGFAFKTVAAGTMVVVTGLMGLRTWFRNPDWADNNALAVSTARDNLQSAKACSWAGSILIMSQDPAIADFGRQLIERAISLVPDYASAYWELAKYYGLHGQLGKSVIYLAQAAQQDPGRHQTRAAMFAVLSDLRMTDPGLYMPVLEEHQRTHADDPTAYLALALGYHAQHKWDEAEANALKAADLQRERRGNGWDQFHEAVAELAAIQYERGNLEQAIETYRVYLTWMRGSIDGRCEFARMLMERNLWQHTNSLDEAAYHLAIADLIEPGNPNARMARGQLYRLQKNLRKHVEELATASALSGGKQDDLTDPFVPAKESGARP